MDLGLSGRIALVTGASAGIGRATAAALVAEGARVAISSRSKDRIASAAEAIGATGLVWDSADLDAVPALVSSVAEALDGPVEVLVCNTGGPPFGPDPLAFSRDEWEAAHRTLVLGPLALVRTVLPGMRDRRWGASSTSARRRCASPSPT